MVHKRYRKVQVLEAKTPVSFVSDEVAFSIDNDTVNEGETIAVHIDRNNLTEKGWIGTFPKNEGTGEWDVYEYVKPSTKCVFLHIKTFGRPGPWQLRFFRDSSHDNMCGFLDFTVVGEKKSPVVMTIDKNMYKSGGVVAVNITSTEPFPDRSWIGLFPASCPSRWFSSAMWQFVHEGGKINLNIEDNHNHGPYELRYFPSSQYQPLLHVPFFVESERHIELTCTPRVLDGKTITIKWDPSLYPLQIFGKYNDKNEAIRPWIKLFPKRMLSTFILEDRYYLKEGETTVQLYAESGILMPKQKEFYCDDNHNFITTYLWLAAKKFVVEARRHCPNAPCILVGTKTDLRDARYQHDKQRYLPSVFGEYVARETGCLAYIETSSKTEQGIDELKRAIVRVQTQPEKNKKKCELM